MSGRGGIYKGPNGEKLYGDGREVKAEPPLAPQTERVIEVAPQGEISDEIARFNVVDLSHRRMVQENHGLYVKWIDHVAALRASREERDRAQEALAEAYEFSRQVAAHPWIDEKRLPSWNPEKWAAALKPVSDRQPEGEAK